MRDFRKELKQLWQGGGVLHLHLAKWLTLLTPHPHAQVYQEAGPGPLVPRV